MSLAAKAPESVATGEGANGWHVEADICVLECGSPSAHGSRRNGLKLSKFYGQWRGGNWDGDCEAGGGLWLGKGYVDNPSLRFGYLDSVQHPDLLDPSIRSSRPAVVLGKPPLTAWHVPFLSLSSR